MTFKKIKPGKQRILGVPTVRITEREFFFNRQAVDKYLKEKEGIEVFLDEENRRVGFKPRDKRTEDSFNLRIYRADTSPVAAVFVPEVTRKVYSWLKQTKTFVLEDDKDSGLLIVKLN